ncbi:2-dehydro-3-deoxygalactonokinase, partial [Citreimonas sp.]|uniref:2-dehydro-3-deoxygalactonokinase n=1 Tax=Citreimonas sp. TaxID=3036715 RepID=UPI0035C870F1
MHDPTQRPDWIALDWRAAAPRVWLMTDEGSVIDTRASDSKGQNGDGFGSVLLALIGDVLDGAAPMPVIGCGTAGGQVRAPGVAVPAPPPSGEAALRIETRDPRLDLRILPGMRQGAPADMMTGEETTLAGALAARPGFDGVFCLPGAHTRWVQVSAGEIVSFRTFMTGELFALLARQSVLSSDMGEEGAWDDAAFAEAVGDAISRPQGIGAALFGIRADAVLNGLAPGAARARLAGLLIG